MSLATFSKPSFLISSLWLGVEKSTPLTIMGVVPTFLPSMKTEAGAGDDFTEIQRGKVGAGLASSFLSAEGASAGVGVVAAWNSVVFCLWAGSSGPFALA